MSMERAIMNELGHQSYRASRITHILSTLGLGDIKQGVMVLSYAGIPVYLASEYNMDQIYMTIIENKHRNGETTDDIMRWLAGQNIEAGLMNRLRQHYLKSA